MRHRHGRWNSFGGIVKNQPVENVKGAVELFEGMSLPKPGR
jgi:hypothetical protein